MGRKKINKSIENMMGNSKLKYVIIGIVSVIVIYLLIGLSVRLMKRPPQADSIPDARMSAQQEQRLVDFSESRESSGGVERITEAQKKRLEDFYKSRQ